MQVTQLSFRVQLPGGRRVAAHPTLHQRAAKVLKGHGPVTKIKGDAFTAIFGVKSRDALDAQAEAEPLLKSILHDLRLDGASVREIRLVPNTELAESLGLECDNGIRVDRYGVTSDGHTVAIGDCANMPNPTPGAPADERLRLESVNNAVEHAKVAAYSLTGRREEYRSIPWFWSNQGEYKLQIAGLSTGHDHTVVRRDGSDGKLCVLYYRENRLIAADCVNAGVDFLDVKAALGKDLTVDPDHAADTSRRLKDLAAAPTPQSATRS